MPRDLMPDARRAGPGASRGSWRILGGAHVDPGDDALATRRERAGRDDLPVTLRVRAGKRCGRVPPTMPAAGEDSIVPP
jgi:hypothetical protein